MESEQAPDLGWHAISGEQIITMLRRAHDGESPDLLFAEMWANAEDRRDYSDDEADDREEE